MSPAMQRVGEPAITAGRGGWFRARHLSGGGGEFPSRPPSSWSAIGAHFLQRSRYCFVPLACVALFVPASRRRCRLLGGVWPPLHQRFETVPWMRCHPDAAWRTWSRCRGSTIALRRSPGRSRPGTTSERCPERNSDSLPWWTLTRPTCVFSEPSCFSRENALRLQLPAASNRAENARAFHFRPVEFLVHKQAKRRNSRPGSASTLSMGSAFSLCAGESNCGPEAILKLADQHAARQETSIRSIVTATPIFPRKVGRDGAAQVVRRHHHGTSRTRPTSTSPPQPPRAGRPATTACAICVCRLSIVD